MRVRLPASRTPKQLAAALRRETAVRANSRRTERALRDAGRRGRPVLLGPFVGEIGYELLYWIPFLRRELRRAAVPPERATVLTRGGAGVWYSDLAAKALDVFELVPPEDFLRRLEARRRKAGDAKQLLVEAFDRELVAEARLRLGECAVIHPSLMFARLRGLWFTGLPLEEGLAQLEHGLLPTPDLRVEGLPQTYVAVKPYFNDCVSDSERNRAALRIVIERLAATIDVVLLSTGLALDDHDEWDAPEQRVHRVDHLLHPGDNLEVQTRVIAGARGLVATYGGFSYLGPYLGVPTLTFMQHEATVSLHLEVLREALPHADYSRVRLDDADAFEAFGLGVAA